MTSRFRNWMRIARALAIFSSLTAVPLQAAGLFGRHHDRQDCQPVCQPICSPAPACSSVCEPAAEPVVIVQQNCCADETTTGNAAVYDGTVYGPSESHLPATSFGNHYAPQPQTAPTSPALAPQTDNRPGPIESSSAGEASPSDAAADAPAATTQRPSTDAIEPPPVIDSDIVPENATERASAAPIDAPPPLSADLPADSPTSPSEPAADATLAEPAEAAAQPADATNEPATTPSEPADLFSEPADAQPADAANEPVPQPTEATEPGETPAQPGQTPQLDPPADDLFGTPPAGGVAPLGDLFGGAADNTLQPAPESPADPADILSTPPQNEAPADAEPATSPDAEVADPFGVPETEASDTSPVEQPEPTAPAADSLDSLFTPSSDAATASPANDEQGLDDIFGTTDPAPAADSDAPEADAPAADAPALDAPEADAPAADTPDAEGDATNDLDSLFNSGVAPVGDGQQIAEAAPEIDIKAIFVRLGDQTFEPSSTADYRNWSDDTGRFGCHAKLLFVTATHARLLKDNSRTATVELDRLSATDRAYVAGEIVAAMNASSMPLAAAR